MLWLLQAPTHVSLAKASHVTVSAVKGVGHLVWSYQEGGAWEISVTEGVTTDRVLTPVWNHLVLYLYMMRI